MTHPDHKETSVTQHALIGRFIHENADLASPLLTSDLYALNPGEAMVFVGAGDTDVLEPVRLKQSEFVRLPRILEGKPMQLLVALDAISGGLLIMEDFDNQISINPAWPATHRVGIAEYGRIKYGFILGNTEAEAKMILAELSAKNSQWN